MSLIDVRVPQMGEGLEEVIVRRLYKRPGDRVERDEVIYAMETDKADMDVESPVAGRLDQWLAGVGDVLPVGATIARIASEAGASAMAPRNPVASRPSSLPRIPTTSVTTAPRRRVSVPTVTGRTDVVVPPRTRAYCRHLGLHEQQVLRIPAKTDGTLTPDDVDRFLAEDRGAVDQAAAGPPTEGYHDLALPEQQRIVNYRLQRSAERVIPATMGRRLDWRRFEAAVEAMRSRHPEAGTSEFAVFAFCVSRATVDHPRFRSTLLDGETVRRWDHLNLGVAVHRGDELATAVVARAESLDFPAFSSAAELSIRRVLEGEDQASKRVQLHLSYVVDYEITIATPLVVAPAVAVVFLGAPFGHDDRLEANLGVSFDHRLINGADAANFLNGIARQIDLVSSGDNQREARGTGPLPEVDPEERQEQLAALVAGEIGELLGLEPEELDQRQALTSLGLNSRLATQLTERLATRLELNLPVTLAWNHPSVVDLVAYLARRLAPEETSSAEDLPAGERSTSDGLLDRIEELSEEEAQALLDQKLRRS